jgi:hypothetical protein
MPLSPPIDQVFLLFNLAFYPHIVAEAAPGAPLPDDRGRRRRNCSPPAGCPVARADLPPKTQRLTHYRSCPRGLFREDRRCRETRWAQTRSFQRCRLQLQLQRLNFQNLLRLTTLHLNLNP